MTAGGPQDLSKNHNLTGVLVATMRNSKIKTPAPD